MGVAPPPPPPSVYSTIQKIIFERIKSFSRAIAEIILSNASGVIFDFGFFLRITTST